MDSNIYYEYRYNSNTFTRRLAFHILLGKCIIYVFILFICRFQHHLTMNKIPISEGIIDGNMQDMKQVYKINYMPEEIINGKQYNEKLELAILFEKDKQQVYAYRSIRFWQPVQFKSFIINCIKAYFLFARYKKEITPENFKYRQNKFFRDIEEAFKV